MLFRSLGETGCVGYLFDHRSVVRLEQSDLQEDALLEQLLALEGAGGPAALGYELDPEGAEVIGAVWVSHWIWRCVLP